MSQSMSPDRIRTGQTEIRKGFRRVLYWMQQAQRVSLNQALNLAIELANAAKLPLGVFFVLSDRIPDANLRHYRFLLEGLVETASDLHARGIEFLLLAGDPSECVPALCGQDSLLVADSGYLRWQREWRRQARDGLAPDAYCEVECDAVVPVTIASPKEEYAAATIRGKILKRLSDFLEPAPTPAYQLKTPLRLEVPGDFPCLKFQPGLELQNLLDFAGQTLRIDSDVPPSDHFRGGYKEARRCLRLFLEQRLHLYGESRSDPGREIQSDLSPHLHFGQISALELALIALEYCEVPSYAASDLIRDKSNLEPLQAGLASWLEELIVRRELACNFCHYNPAYDSYECVPLWARTTLNDHLHDPRPHLYPLEALETAQTADPYWNAAQNEMLFTGKMHNYMRMYWGKKLIEWTPDPETAFQIMLYLNNKYELDGRDPNSFAGVAWCFGKHDRPWQQRPVFGSVRYMNAAGLKRKFDMSRYLERVARL